MSDDGLKGSDCRDDDPGANYYTFCVFSCRLRYVLQSQPLRKSISICLLPPMYCVMAQPYRHPNVDDITVKETPDMGLNSLTPEYSPP